jgi:hypothetical protein
MNESEVTSIMPTTAPGRALLFAGLAACGGGGSEPPAKHSEHASASRPAVVAELDRGGETHGLVVRAPARAIEGNDPEAPLVYVDDWTEARRREGLPLFAAMNANYFEYSDPEFDEDGKAIHGEDLRNKHLAPLGVHCGAERCVTNGFGLPGDYLFDAGLQKKPILALRYFSHLLLRDGQPAVVLHGKGATEVNGTIKRPSTKGVRAAFSGAPLIVAHGVVNTTGFAGIDYYPKLRDNGWVIGFIGVDGEANDVYFGYRVGGTLALAHWIVEVAPELDTAFVIDSGGSVSMTLEGRGLVTDWNLHRRVPSMIGIRDGADP